jgi:D-alanyl-D-alanine carboxypeptidase
MLKPAAVVAALAILAALPAAAQRTSPRMLHDGRAIDELVADFMAEHDVPGMALAIVQAPYIPRVTGFGVADVERALLVSSNTLFDIGGLADAYTAVAVMQLVETRRLALDDPIGRHVPAVPEPWRAATVRQLLLHESGLPDYAAAGGYQAGRRYEPAQLVEMAAATPPAFAPGTGLAASATNYLLLTLAIEAAGGEPYRAFVRRHQFDRLGLRQTIFADEADRVRSEAVEQQGNRHRRFLEDVVFINPTELATGYRGAAGGRTPVRAERAYPASGSAPILASATDISIWDIGLAGGILVADPALRALLYDPATRAEDHGRGALGPWRFPGRPGLMYATGSANGHTAFLSRFTHPTELVCVTLLANREGLDLTQLARRIAGAYDPRLGPPALPEGMRAQQSPFSVRETIDRLDRVLREDGFGVMARVDHAAGASRVSLELAPTEQLIFGDPADGTRLMQRVRGAALELPLRAVAWEEDGQVWLGYTDAVAIARRSKVQGQDDLARAMRDRLDRLALKAVIPY